MTTPSASFLTDEATVLRALALVQGEPNRYPVDQSAGRDDELVAVPGLAGLACSVQPESGRAGQVYGQRVLNIDTCVYFAQAVDVRRDDVLEVAATGWRYIVEALGDEAQQGRVSWVLCRRLG